jgi:hypothetical protein
MEEWRPESYGERIADRYDELFAELDPADAVDALVRLAGGRGPVLELRHRDRPHRGPADGPRRRGARRRRL